jgi:glycosyltransferase involved in cell wall biosynthesis
MRVVLVISSLGPGGAERVMSLLAGELVARGHEVRLVTLAQAVDDFFALDPRVHRLSLDLSGQSARIQEAVCANFRRIRALRRAVKTAAPDVVLSFMTSTNVLVLLACIGLPVRVVVSERVDPARHREARFWAGLRFVAYHRADAIVVQTEATAKWYRRRLGKHPGVIVIPNPVAAAGEPRQHGMDVPKPFVLAAGRLVHQKGFDVLIRAFAAMARECEPLRLAIAGDGPEARALRGLVAELQLEDRVLFLGQVKELGSLMRQAEAFILSSRYEGFPNVLLEALASELPVVSTDCPSGPREILRDGEFGLLVPCEDPAALAAAVRRVVTDTELRRRLSRLGQRAIADYELSRVVAGWEDVLSGARL